MQTLERSAAAYTHAGRRRANQDAVVVHSFASGAGLLAVADGMGGHLAGEVASALALDELTGRLEAGEPLAAAVTAANARVYHESQADPELAGMGTTLVALLRGASEYHVANVGDSRAYRIEADSIRRLTEDHSYVAEALKGGVMTAEEAERSPWRNALTRAIGTETTVEVDVFGPFAVDEPHAVLLCSDGLYKSVSDEIVREYLLSTDDLGAALESLAALAYRRGSDDNITLAVVEFGTLQRRPPLITLPLPIGLQSATPRKERSRPHGQAAAMPPAAAPAEGAQRRVAQAAEHARAAPDRPQPRPRSGGRSRRTRRDRRRVALGSTLILLSVLILLAGWFAL